MSKIILAAILSMMPAYTQAQEMFQKLGLQAITGSRVALTYAVDVGSVSQYGSIQTPDGDTYNLAFEERTQTAQSVLEYRYGWGNPKVWWHEFSVGLAHTDLSVNWTGSVNQIVDQQTMSVSGASDVRLGFKTSVQINPAIVLTYGASVGYSIQTTWLGSGEEYWVQETYLTYNQVESPIGFYGGYQKRSQHNYFFGDNPTETVVIGAVYDPDGPWSFHVQSDWARNIVADSRVLGFGIGYQVTDHFGVGLEWKTQNQSAGSVETSHTQGLSLNMSYSF